VGDMKTCGRLVRATGASNSRMYLTSLRFYHGDFPQFGSYISCSEKFEGHMP
jgi:hypothetical protein